MPAGIERRTPITAALALTDLPAGARAVTRAALCARSETCSAPTTQRSRETEEEGAHDKHDNP